MIGEYLSYLTLSYLIKVITMVSVLVKLGYPVTE